MINNIIHIISQFDTGMIIGIAGAALFVLAHIRLQISRDYARQSGYSITNICASLLLATSFFMSGVIIGGVASIMWFAISLFGFYKSTHPDFSTENNPRNHYLYKDKHGH